MPQINDIRAFIIEFNNSFPLDREYRKKYNIGFNSPAHRNICQIDVYLESFEDEIFKEYEESVAETVRKRILYNKGEWISEQKASEEDQSKAFDSIDINKL